MRIALVISALTTGGAQRQLLLLADGLQKRGHIVVVVTLRGTGSFDSWAADHDLEVSRHGGSTLVGRIGGLIGAARFLRGWKPDVVNSYLTAPNVWMTILRPSHGAALVWGVRGTIGSEAKHGWRGSFVQRLSVRLSSRADIIISNSHEGARQQIRRGYPSALVRVIPNGIDLLHFRAHPETRERLRSVGGMENHVVIGMLARLDPMKGHHLLLRSFASGFADRPDVRLVLHGDGRPELGQGVSDLASELGIEDRVEISSATAAVETLQTLDILVVASKFGEGFPNVIGEAAACGLPVVTTDVGDAGRIVSEPFLGTVVAPNDENALAAALVDAVERLDDSPETAAKRRAHIETHFSAEALAERTESALLEAIELRSGRRPAHPKN